MICDVLLHKDNSQYIARVRDWPEIIVKEKTREEAIRKVRTRLGELLNQGEMIQIEIPLLRQTSNPWLDKFGSFRDDPTFDDFLSEIHAYRREMDKAEYGDESDS